MSTRRPMWALALLVLLLCSPPRLVAADLPDEATGDDSIVTCTCLDAGDAAEADDDEECDCPCCRGGDDDEGDMGDERGTAQPKRLRRASGLKTWETGRRFGVQPALFSCQDFQPTLALTLSWARKMGYQDTAVTMTGARPKVREPDDEYRVTVLRLRYERRHYVRNRLFVTMGGGVQHVKPSLALRNFYGALGQNLEAEFRPFASVGLGWQIHRMRLGSRWLPLVARVGYEAARTYRLPSPLAESGVSELDTSGLGLSLAVNFRW